jgi:glutamate carboxypeptidase
VANKKWLVDGHILNRHDAFSALEFQYSVDQQEWVAVRQNPHNLVDIERGLFQNCHVTNRLKYVRHDEFKREDYTVPRTRQRTLIEFKDMKKAQAKSKPDTSAVADVRSRLQYFEQRREQVVQTIRQLVEVESPTDNKAGVDRLGSLLAGRFEGLGGHAKFHRTQNFGDHLQVDFPGKSGGKPVMLLGHLDTVYPLGTLKTMPFNIADGRVRGPGSFDMKSGIAFMMHAIEALRTWHGDELPRPVTVLLVSDEEVGSDTSRHITENLAKKSAAVLVLEPAYGPKGAVKTARKGVGEYLLKVTGKAAHSGLDFEEGESAIIELARQILEISKLTDVKRGITLNVGTVQGGTRSNVIPAEASAVVDARVMRMKDAAGLDRKVHSLKAFNRKCKLEISGGMNRPPLERTPMVAALYKKASDIAKQLGWKLEEAAVGGGSDGNLTAALGIPTLDGLGGVGEGAHATHESILISELPRRTALLAQLIETV